MPKPHGGKLITRKIENKADDLSEYPKIEISTNLSEDILNIANGVFSPIEGFAVYNDLDNIVGDKRLSNDTPWTIPILLDYRKINELREGDSVLLTNDETGVKAILEIEDIYDYDHKKISAEFSMKQIKEAVNDSIDLISGGKISDIYSKNKKLKRIILPLFYGTLLIGFFLAEFLIADYIFIQCQIFMKRS